MSQVYFHHRKSDVGCSPPSPTIRRLGCSPAAHAPVGRFSDTRRTGGHRLISVGYRHKRSGCFWAKARVESGCFRQMRDDGSSRLLLLVPTQATTSCSSDAPRAKSGADSIRPFFVSSARSPQHFNTYQPISMYVNRCVLLFSSIGLSEPSRRLMQLNELMPRALCPPTPTCALEQAV